MALVVILASVTYFLYQYVGSRQHDDHIEPVAYKHKSVAIQGALHHIQLWLTSFSLPLLTTYCTNKSEAEFSKSVLLELIENYPELLIDYLHNQPSRVLAGSLAHLIVNAIGVPLDDQESYGILANLLCVCNDSFVIDYVLVCLGSRTTLCLSTSFSKRITKYIFFLQSKSPKYKEKKTFCDKLILSIKTLNEIDSIRFRGLLEDIMYQVERISTGFSRTPCLLAGDEHSFENKAVGDTSVLGYNTCKSCYDVFGSDQSVAITPTNATYNYLCKYRSHHIAQKEHIEDLMTNLQACIRIQSSCMDGCSSLVALGLAQIKNACAPIFEQIEQAEQCLMDFERGFVLFHLCRIIPVTYIRNKFANIGESAVQERNVHVNDLLELGELASTKTQFYLSLRMTLTLSNRCSDSELGKVWQDRISCEEMECKDFILGYSRLLKVWTQLTPIIESNETTYTLLHNLKPVLEQEAKDVKYMDNTLALLYNEICIVNSKRFCIFLGRNQLRLLDPLYKIGRLWQDRQKETRTPESAISLITSEVIQQMIESTSKDILELITKVTDEKKSWEQGNLSQNRNLGSAVITDVSTVRTIPAF